MKFLLHMIGCKHGCNHCPQPMRRRLYVQAHFKNHSVVNNDSQLFRSLVKGKFIVSNFGVGQIIFRLPGFSG